MRNIFVKEISNYLINNKDSYFLTADLGYNAFEALQKIAPDRFINTGVGENNMIGVACGMAMSGKKIFAYSIVPFLIFRSFEIIRNYISHNSLDVTLVGAGGGFSYGNQGISHNSFEDIALIRTLPNLKIFSPGTKNEVVKCCNMIFNSSGPSYMRLGKAPNNDYNISKTELDFGEFYSDGKDLLIITSGNIIEEVMKTNDMLLSKSIKSSVLSLPVLKPLNDKILIKILKNYKIVFSVEENGLIGGLGSIISEIIVKNNLSNIIYNIGLDDKVHNELGDQKFLRLINKLDFNSLFQLIFDSYKKHD